MGDNGEGRPLAEAARDRRSDEQPPGYGHQPFPIYGWYVCEACPRWWIARWFGTTICTCGRRGRALPPLGRHIPTYGDDFWPEEST